MCIHDRNGAGTQVEAGDATVALGQHDARIEVVLHYSVAHTSLMNFCAASSDGAEDAVERMESNGRPPRSLSSTTVRMCFSVNSLRNRKQDTRLAGFCTSYSAHALVCVCEKEPACRVGVGAREQTLDHEAHVCARHMHISSSPRFSS